MKYFDNYNKSNNSLKGDIRLINSDFAYIVTKIQKEIFLILGNKNINRCFDNNQVIYEIISEDYNYIKTNNLEEYKFNHFVSILEKEFKILGMAKIVNLESENSNLSVAGILQINSKTVYGINKRKLPIYLFKPFSAKFPNFCVASSYKSNKKNVYCVAKFKEWNINQKLPIGTCEKIIGEVGIINNEYNYLLDSYYLNYTNYKRKIIQNSVKKIQDCYSENKNINRVDFRNNQIFSIDPPNCKDIDDAIHVNKDKNGNIELGIHIADVSYFIKENSDIDLLAKKRISSIYFPHKIINMLPDVFSNDICSLTPNTEKMAFSLILKLDSNYQIKDLKFCKTVIMSKKALAYQESEKILNSKPNNMIEESLHLLYDISEKWNLVPLNCNNENNKSHHIIETMMILINSKAAEFLYSYNPKTAVIRTHQKKMQNLVHENENLNKFLNLIHSESAIYQMNTDKEKIFHESLNLKFYTHFSSPIRRYIDIIIHRLMSGLIENRQYIPDNKMIDTINQFNNTLKIVYRKQKEIDFVHTFQDQEILNAYIIEFDPFYNKIQLYFTKYDISYTTQMFSSKLDSILTYQYLDDQCKITNQHNKKCISFKKLDSVFVKFISQLDNDNNAKKAFVTLMENKNSSVLQFLEI